MKPTINYRPIEKFLSANPHGTHKEFLTKSKGFRISDAAFYTFRKKFSGGGKSKRTGNATSIMAFFKPRDGQHKAYKKAIDFIKANPDVSYTRYEKAVSGKKLSDSTYYRVKNKTNGNGAVHTTTVATGSPMVRKRKNLYMSVFSTSSEVPLAAKKLLKDFVEVLNSTKRTKMEVVEYNDPKEIEVREVR